MKKFMSFEEFINEKYKTEEKKSVNEEVDYKVAQKLLDDLYNQDQKVKDSNYDMKEIKKLDSIEKEIVKIGLAPKLGSAWIKEKTPKQLHKQYIDYGYSWLGENKIEESINSRVRSKIVVHLKNQGIEQGEDYDYAGGEFLAKNMDVAQDIADAAADKFRVTIYDDRITKDGKIPMMIVENELKVATAVAEVPTINLNQTVEKPIAKEDIKGFHKLDSIKKDIENSKVALEKMKTLIDQGIKDKKLTENYIKLLEHRTNLIKEMNTIIEQTKQTITKK